jgi:DNA-binding NtrC family response regulator
MMRVMPVRVFVLDDDEAVCRKISGWLTDAAYDVVTFTDPLAALEYAHRVFSPIALVDLRLPDANAVEVISTLGRLSPQVRVIGMAAFPELPHVLAAMRAGARDILEKPIRPAALLEALERQLVELGMVARSEEEYNRWLGARIRAARAAVNLTLSEVALSCGLSAAQLSQIELGKTGTTAWSFARICAALNTRPTTLLNGI